MIETLVNIATACCYLVTACVIVKYAYGRFIKGKDLSTSLVREKEHNSFHIEQALEQLPNDEKVNYSSDVYKTIFFTKERLKHRTQTYIEKENHDLIRSLLALIAPDINISSYVNMIVKEHLEENRHVIKELLKGVKIKSL